MLDRLERVSATRAMGPSPRDGPPAAAGGGGGGG
eukprot:COSAG01_NODE_48920_length_376_cov_6.548736_1_plen_33_part_10